MTFNNPKKEKGFSLLEVLITVFILSIGLLGLAGLQTTSLKNNHSAQHRTSAIILSYDIVDRMRLNKNVSYSLALGDNPAGGSLKDQDLVDWTTDLANSLPSGDGSVVIVGDIVTVTVQWDDSRATEGSSTQSFSMSTQL
ncbi:MAG: type IV pilus modification protein PilV [Gammaproteobacteria bacterium]|nr:MAG: type IV pilus modification protein PilV [Gammaproteobacteria bacterium]